MINDFSIFLECCRCVLKKQALDKLRGKNGDVKITAKDGFCMQKLLGGYDQDINYQLMSRLVASDLVQGPLWLHLAMNEPATNNSSRGMESDTQNISQYSLQFLTVIYSRPAYVLRVLQCQKVLDVGLWTNSFAFSLLKIYSLLQSFSLSLSL